MLWPFEPAGIRLPLFRIAKVSIYFEKSNIGCQITNNERRFYYICLILGFGWLRLPSPYSA